ncbi:hypothetical protein GE09DRAFT_733107 [Coniochaeta sp. 2T2.1]|nr:hypothetical protein GE09DRAFT_733107 [Coniochaeta sp. 2T2.1]
MSCYDAASRRDKQCSIDWRSEHTVVKIDYQKLQRLRSGRFRGSIEDCKRIAGTEFLPKLEENRGVCFSQRGRDKVRSRSGCWWGAPARWEFSGRFVSFPPQAGGLRFPGQEQPSASSPPIHEHLPHTRGGCQRFPLARGSSSRATSDVSRSDPLAWPGYGRRCAIQRHNTPLGTLHDGDGYLVGGNGTHQPPVLSNILVHVYLLLPFEVVNCLTEHVTSPLVRK